MTNACIYPGEILFLTQNYLSSILGNTHIHKMNTEHSGSDQDVFEA